MTIHIQAGVIHQIKKQQNAPSANASLQLQGQLHTANHHLSTFVDYAEQQLQKSGKNSSISGGFGIQHTLSKVLASSYFSSQVQIDYLQLSKDLAQGLYHFVTQKTATTGEYVPMVFYRKDEVDYLLISLISLNKYINIDSQGEFSDTNVIDNDALKIGIKINLTQMAAHYAMPNGDQPDNYYIQWIQRGNSKLPEYIQEFIPVGEKIDNGRTTSSLLKNVKNYTSEVFKDPKIRHKVETDIVTLMRNKFENGESVHIEEDIDVLLNSALTTYGLDNQLKFSEYRQEHNVVLDSSFKVDAAKLKPYEKFDLSLSNKGILIKGEMKELGKTVFVETDETNEKKYLKIELEQDEFSQITQRYESLLQ
ncbi:nucleoid-associated protein [Actinobacillus equuli]|uniref:Nucleoid-associated protein NdpA n=1 Tax=Actinobacillus equuli TaxID=718 RepID=A0AAX3FP90_ACTEU|nr:nucleoid-associated protein [Actinobacillus equuli]AIZ78450.1 nucleoid-associated protein NdpA [Actinobacillus equuli subsp. equuli]WGE44717.1 nucleoid-associated protein [Actinobacillus equuli subsp. equuli]VEE92346.1 nucleoid-associated protein NdpA [Actinobacillus equuli]